jgi:hypothetical protein
MGLGSDIAAALERKKGNKKRKIVVWDFSLLSTIWNKSKFYFKQ